MKSEGEEKEKEWKEVYKGGGEHLERVIKEYEELRFEIKVEPLPINECEGCVECYKEEDEQIFRLYVRKGKDEE